MWFNQHFNDPNGHESCFNDAFVPSKTNHATFTPLTEENEFSNDTTGINNNNSVQSNVLANERVTNTMYFTICEEEHKDCANAKAKVRFHDTVSSMPHFINFKKYGLRRSYSVSKDAPAH